MKNGEQNLANKHSHSLSLFQNAFYSINDHLQNMKEPCKPDEVDIKELLCKGSQAFLLFFETIDHAYRRWLNSGEIVLDLEILEPLDEVYGMLEDEESQRVFDWQIRFMAALLLTNSLTETERLYPYLCNGQSNFGEIVSQRIKLLDGFTSVDGYSFESCPAELFFGTWICDNYRLADKCEPCRNDIVIDAGAFTGDTSIWFADRVGRSGKVYSFEIIPSHVELLRKNAGRNHLQDVIHVIDKGLWDKETLLYANEAGYDSRCSETVGDIKIKTITLDSFVQQEHLSGVDFIKMDIEGAELNALKGGTVTLKKFKPKLAISIYHSPYDIIEIPRFLKAIVPEYKLFLSHKCPYPTDIILFASVNPNRRKGDSLEIA